MILNVNLRKAEVHQDLNIQVPVAQVESGTLDRIRTSRVH